MTSVVKLIVSKHASIRLTTQLNANDNAYQYTRPVATIKQKTIKQKELLNVLLGKNNKRNVTELVQ